MRLMRKLLKKLSMLQKSYLLLFVLSVFYILFIQSKLYLSNASVIIRDINAKPAVGFDLSVLGAGTSSQMQDSKVLEAYLNSYDVLEQLDDSFHLNDYYHSDAVDPLHRLYAYSTREDFLQTYRNHLSVLYDEISGILTIAFYHTDAHVSQSIVQFLITHAEQQLNFYNHLRAQRQLGFIKEQVQKNRLSLDTAIARLEQYQNSHQLIDPMSEIATKNTIIATLEADLVQKRAELELMLQYMNAQSYDVKKLAAQIKTMQSALERNKAKLSGSQKDKLNKTFFEYEKLKSQVEFEKEVYAQSLGQLELATVEASQLAKALVVLIQPTLPDGIASPEYFRSLFTLLILFLLSYGIIVLVLGIIKDHKD